MIIGRDFLTLADSLLAGGTEAEWRTAVSRAYYAAFHVARELMLDLGFAVPRGDRAHGYLWLRLSNSGDASIQIAGHRLKDVRGERNRADYDLANSFPRILADGNIKLARGIISACGAATTEPTRSQIMDAMKICERDVLKDVTWHP
ncbi:MAG TPA: HEPN domain-containing protein [Gemmataceae bacterium]|jgi:uncharacterized protein (UPF0332 family)